jgi:hypothetical protein
MQRTKKESLTLFGSIGIPVRRRPSVKPSFSRVRASPTAGPSPRRPAGVTLRPEESTEKEAKTLIEVAS